MKTREEYLAAAEAMSWLESEDIRYATPYHYQMVCDRIAELRAQASQVPEQEPVAYMIWAPFSGPAQFTTDKSAPVKTAQRADYTCTPLYAHSAPAPAPAEELGRQNYRLINELAETNAAFSEAVHMHQQELERMCEELANVLSSSDPRSINGETSKRILLARWQAMKENVEVKGGA